MILVSTDMKASVDRCNAWVSSPTISPFDPRWHHLVIVKHEHELTSHVFEHAFVMNDPEDRAYCWVITMLMGCHVFNIDELSACAEFEEVSRILLE